MDFENQKEMDEYELSGQGIPEMWICFLPKCTTIVDVNLDTHSTLHSTPGEAWHGKAYGSCPDILPPRARARLKWQASGGGQKRQIKVTFTDQDS